jgi:fatty acid kinase fatty acid binding subunit
MSREASGPVTVVTDSTSYLPRELVEQHGIEVVPLQVVIGGQAHDEGGETSSETVTEALRSWTPVTTSRPGPAAFAEAYDRAAERGAAGVVSIHLSSQMSGTVDSAQLAAKEAPLRVEVVDSRSLGMGLGFAVLAGARLAAEGGSVDDVAQLARERAESSAAVFYVDTLEHLRRGGRIGPAAALLGSAFAVKPLLHLVDGHIEPLEKVRTSAKAIARLEELAVERAVRIGAGPVDVAVHHLANPERAAVLAERLRTRLPQLGDLYVSEVGAVVGAHVGPGMLAVVVAPR